MLWRQMAATIDIVAEQIDIKILILNLKLTQRHYIGTWIH